MKRHYKRKLVKISGLQLCWKKQRIGTFARSGHPAHSSPDPGEIVNARSRARLSENHLHDWPVRIASTTLHDIQKKWTQIFLTAYSRWFPLIQHDVPQNLNL